jgi:hypothetical protein
MSKDEGQLRDREYFREAQARSRAGTITRLRRIEKELEEIRAAMQIIAQSVSASDRPESEDWELR